MNVLETVLARLRTKDDEGSALILALVVVVTLGLLLGSALDFAGTGVGNTPHLRDQRNQLNYAQGTVDGAINNIRNSSIAGTTSGPCPTYAPPVLAAGQNSGADGTTQFRATCTGLDSGNEPGTKAPIFAIQTLGTGFAPNNPNCNNPCPAGINQSSGTNNTLSIDGGIYSAGRVWNKGSGGVDMVVEGSVYAAGSCSGNLHTTDSAGLHCGASQTFGDDPKYAPAINSSAALDTLISSTGVDPAVTCPNSGHHVAYFSPGYYSEQPGSLLESSSDPNCDGSEDVWWFKPGFYYFDFTHAQAGNEWDFITPVGNHNLGVVGGTPTGTWSTQSNPAMPWGSACDATPVSGTDSSPSQPGVQFIFGGNSTIAVGSNDHLELCGPDQAQSPNSTQSVALYGLNGNANQGVFAPTTQTNVERAATAAPTADPASGFHNPDRAQTIDGSTSDANLGTNSTAALAYASFQNIPSGVGDVSAKIRLSRTIVGLLDKETLAIQFPGSTTATTINVPNTCTIVTNPCDIPIPDSAWPSNYPRWRQFNGASLTYTATTKNVIATDSVDGIELLATYTTPALQALNIGSVYFFDGSDPHTSVLMHGTVYSPSGGLDIEGQQNGQVIFSRGVIVSTLLVDSNPSFTQTAAPFQTPGNKAARLVKFIGSVSTDGGSSWTDLVQACVLYGDNNSSGGGGPALPGYTLTVKGWTVLRSSSQQAPTCA